MIITHADQERHLREAGRRLRAVLDSVVSLVEIGVSGSDLDARARDLIEKGGDTPSFLGYRPSDMARPFPASLCVSPDDAVVHGIPKNYPGIHDGIVLSLDCGLCHRGFFVDAATTVVVGTADKKATLLIEATKLALGRAIEIVSAGVRIGDVAAAISAVASEYGFSVPPNLGGHGVGAAQHEPPFIPNVGSPGTGDVLVEGQVLAIEPIFLEGHDPLVFLDSDKFTCRTVSGLRSAHFEHTIIVTKGRPVLVTGPMW